MGTLKTSFEILSGIASALPGPVQAVAETSLKIIQIAEVGTLFRYTTWNLLADWKIRRTLRTPKKTLRSYSMPLET